MKEIRRLLPGEDLLYYADSAHCPYGEKPPEQIRRRIVKITQFLVSRRVKMVVAACNTASIAGLDFLRRLFRLPIVGMEPAVKPAAAATRNGKVGVLATGVTISGERFHSLIRRFANGVEVFTVPCPGLVERVELGLVDHPATKQLLEQYLAPLLSNGVDTIVLGCTHYPFLRPLVESIAGPSMTVIDTGSAVARRVVQVLEQGALQSGRTAGGKEIFFTSGDPGRVKETIARLWGRAPELHCKAL